MTYAMDVAAEARCLRPGSAGKPPRWSSIVVNRRSRLDADARQPCQPC